MKPECLISKQTVIHAVTLTSQGDQELVTGIEYIESPITYDEFMANYLWENKPCILGKWSTEDWKSRTCWVNCNGEIDFEYLIKEYGDAKVPVANCLKKHYNSQEKSDWKFSEYLEYLQQTNKTSLHYLKDWHFMKQFPDHKVYSVLPYFKSDWINEYWDHENKDDYRFVYIGPKGSWTPFHMDVFKSHSWSANVSGKKKWLMFAPGSEKRYLDSNGNLPFDISSKIDESFGDVITVIQQTGETIFVPSGWHHQVHNLEDTISINHNWVNASNFEGMWSYLKSELELVKKEISDCRASMDNEEFALQCQLILLANSGINFEKFINLIMVVGKSRFAALRKQYQGNEDLVEDIKCLTDIPIKEIIQKIINNGALDKIEPHLNHYVMDVLILLKTVSELSTNEDVMLCGLVQKANTIIKDILNVFLKFIM